MKQPAVRALSWLFDRDPLGPAMLVWLYVALWCGTVLAPESQGPLASAVWLDTGWWPSVWWCVGVFAAASYQLFCCRYLHCYWLLRLLASVVASSFVVYTVAAPLTIMWISYQLFPTLAAGSVVVAIASLLVVARCMRLRKCRDQKPMPL